MNQSKLLELATQFGFMSEEMRTIHGSDFYEALGALVSACYRQGLVDSAIPEFQIEHEPEGNEETIAFKVGGEVLCTMDHDRHGWDGMDAAKDLFLAVARKLGMEEVDE